MNNRKYGLKKQCIIALLISAIISLTSFGIIQYAESYLIEINIENSRYADQIFEKYLDSFEKYVLENNVSANNKQAIDKWVKSKRPISIVLYISRDGKPLYDSLQSESNQYTVLIGDENGKNESSDYGESNELHVYAGEEYSSNKWFYQRQIRFSDGIAFVSFYAYFADWIYNVMFLLSLIIAFIVLCVSFLYFLRKKINCILKLESDIKILETGGLDYPISIDGNDEIASLAASLDQMRIALSQNMKEEAYTVKNNYDFVVSVSHDIRTPLTSLGLYLDLIYAGKYENVEQFNSYIGKSREKVSQIKQLTDNLFEKFYLEKDPKFEQPEYVQTVLCDVISETVGYFYENGFDVEDHIAWPKRKIVVSAYYINRIFDNINSNIKKYADLKEPIRLELVEENNCIKISISNRIRQLDKHPESTGVGIKNINFMVEKMNGKSEVYKDNNCFKLILTFPFYE